MSWQISRKSIFFTLLVFLLLSLSYPTNAQVNLRVVGKVETNNALSVSINDTYAYIADSDGGFKIIGISDPNNTEVISTTELDDEPIDVVVFGQNAYVVTRFGDLSIIDISDKQDPSVLQTLELATIGSAISVQDDFAYFAGDTGLTVVNISNPTSASVVGTVSNFDDAWDVEVLDSYVYVADANQGLKIVDIADKANPSIVGSVNTTDFAWGLTVDGAYAYIADEALFHIIDVSDVNNPTIASTLDVNAFAKDVVINNSMAFIAGGGEGLTVVDVTDAASPTIVDNIDTYSAWEVRVKGQYAYIADRMEGFLVVDVYAPITDTDSPARNIENTPDDTVDLFITTVFSGLFILIIKRKRSTNSE